MSILVIAHTGAESAAMPAQRLALRTGDGLRLELSQQGQVVGCTLGKHGVPLLAPGGFAIVDYHHPPAPDKPVSQSIQGTARAAGAGVLFQGEAPGAGLQLRAAFSIPSDCIRVDGELKDTSGKDRAIGVRFELPLDATGWTWHDDIEEHRVVRAPTVYRNTYDGLSGAGLCSIYPWSALSGPNGGLSFGLPLDQGPRIFVIQYDNERRVYSVSFWFGLTAKAEKFPGVAPFSFVLYRHDPAWGMRSAAERFYALFPESFRKRATYDGYLGTGSVEFIEPKTHRLLMSYSSYGAWDQKVEDASDFGVWYPTLYYTGGCYQGYSYTSASGAPLPDEEVVKIFGDKAGDLFKKVALDENGRFVYISDPDRRDDKWWIELRLNEDPDISSGKADATRRALEAYARQADRRPFEAFISADAIEGYFANQRGLDYSPDHIRVSDYPASFGKTSLKPALPNTIWDFLHQAWGPLSEQYQVLIEGNCNLYEQAFTLPFVDVVEFELYARPKGRWERYLRAMSRQKVIRSSYVAVGNRADGADETVEQHLARRLAYAIFPSVYAVENVDTQRRWYRQYVPAIDELSAAGWQPIPYARIGEADVVVERFGDYRNHDLHLTFRNYADKPADVKVSLDLAGLGVPADEAQRLIICDLLHVFEPQPLPPDGWTVHVEPDDSRAFWIGTSEDLDRRGLALADRGLRRVERVFRDDLTKANRAALVEARRRVATAAAGRPAGIPARVEDLQSLLDRLQPAIVTPAPLDRDKVFYRLKADLSSSLLGLLGIRAEAPRAVEGARGVATSVRMTLTNAGSQPLAGLRFSVLSPWAEAAQGSSTQDAPTEVLPGHQERCTFSLFAPAKPERELLPFLLECRGGSTGRPFTLCIPVDLVLKAP